MIRRKPTTGSAHDKAYRVQRQKRPLVQPQALRPAANERGEYELLLCVFNAFSASTLLVGRHEGHPACKLGGGGAGVVICLERVAYGPADAIATHSLSLALETGFTFLVPAQPGSPGQRAARRGVCVCVWLRCRPTATVAPSAETVGSQLFLQPRNLHLKTFCLL